MAIAMASLVLLGVMAVGGPTYRKVEANLVQRATSRTELKQRTAAMAHSACGVCTIALRAAPIVCGGSNARLLGYTDLSEEAFNFHPQPVRFLCQFVSCTEYG